MIEYEKAIFAFLRCIEIEPSHQCYYNLWFCFNHSNKFEEASKCLKIGRQNHPNDPRFFFAAAVNYQGSGLYAEAIESYKLYISHGTNNYFPSYYLDRAKSNLSSQLRKESK